MVPDQSRQDIFLLSNEERLQLWLSISHDFRKVGLAIGYLTFVLFVIKKILNCHCKKSFFIGHSSTVMVMVVCNKNKYRVLSSCDGDHLNQRVPGGTDRTKGMARINGSNQMGLQKPKFPIS